ncbi:MAG: histidine phosphatase family protein [bacterium]|nr:histidine phosphatase family protein [bacterium]
MKNLKNRYFLLRHGESLVNVKELCSCWPEIIYSPLTCKGVSQVKKTVEKLQSKHIDLIFSSDILRTKQTAQITAKALGLKIKFDKRLRDIGLGIFNGKSIKEAGKFWAVENKKLSALEYYKRRFTIKSPKGENYNGVERRLSSFIKETEKQYQGKNILLVGHKRPFTLFEKIILNLSVKKFVEEIVQKKEMENAELREIK